jgi:hypothetical protein
MTEPSKRNLVDSISTDPCEEMGAIARSVAAAFAIGISLEVLFHEGGYRGGGAALAENFACGQTIGVTMLALYGLSAEPHRAAEEGLKPSPFMRKWLR